MHIWMVVSVNLFNALVQRDQLFTGEQPIFAALLSYCMHVNILDSEPSLYNERRRS